MKKFALFILIAMLILVACGGEETAETVEVTRAGSQIVAEGGALSSEPRSVPNVGTESGPTVTRATVIESPADEAAESAADRESATESSGAIAIAPMATATLGSAPIAPPVYPEYEEYVEEGLYNYNVNPFVQTNVDNLSTFALDVDTGSYSIARRYLEQNQMPPIDQVRVEEFVNAFEAGYDAPNDAAFAVYADGAPSPFHNDGTHFLRVGVQGYDVRDSERPSASLTFVIDRSGSMGAPERLPLLKEALNLLVLQMRPDDTIGIVVYSSDPQVILDPTPASDRQRILNAIYSLTPGGSTNLEGGLLVGYDMANRAYRPGGINRVILASDGIANVGSTTANSIIPRIRDYADAGITLTTVGFGMRGFNDALMEQLADNGDGNYAYVDTLDEARTLFVDNLTSTLQVIALDAKIQVIFNPEVVSQYRLIGYENRAVADSDFRNNDVDAGEIGAGHTAVALYALNFVPGAEGRIGTVQLRWQDPDSRAVAEIAGDVFTDDLAAAFDRAPQRFQVAVITAEFAELLRHSVYAGEVSYNDLRIRAERLALQLGDPQVNELAQLITRAAGVPY